MSGSQNSSSSPRRSNASRREVLETDLHARAHLEHLHPVLELVQPAHPLAGILLFAGGDQVGDGPDGRGGVAVGRGALQHVAADDEVELAPAQALLQLLTRLAGLAMFTGGLNGNR